MIFVIGAREAKADIGLPVADDYDDYDPGIKCTKISLVTFNCRVLRLPQIEFSRRNRHGNRPFLIGLKSRTLLNYIFLNQYSGFSAAKQSCQVEIRFYSCWRTLIFFLFFTW